MSDEFDSLVADALQAALSQTGWNFSYVKGRRHSDATPWSLDRIR
jgi:hypothetical protein